MFAMLLISASRAHGQEPIAIPAEQIQALTVHIDKQFGPMLNRMFNRRVKMSPALIVVDPKTNSAVIEFSNTTKGTLTADVTIALAPLPGGNQPAPPPSGSKETGGSPAADPQTKSAPTADSIDPKRSLIPWVNGLPSRITLAPGERKQITLRLTVPRSVDRGEYSAWISTATELMQEVLLDGDGTSGAQGTKVSFENVKNLSLIHI